MLFIWGSDARGLYVALGVCQRAAGFKRCPRHSRVLSAPALGGDRPSGWSSPCAHSRGPERPGAARWVPRLVASSLLPSRRKTHSWLASWAWGGGDEHWCAAHSCRAPFIPRRCRKLNFDDALGCAAGVGGGLTAQKGRNEALLPRERGLIGLSSGVKRCCRVISTPLYRRASGSRGSFRRGRLRAHPPPRRRQPPELGRAGVTGHQGDLGLSEGGPGCRRVLPGLEVECWGAWSSRPLCLGGGGHLGALGCFSTHSCAAVHGSSR